MTKIQRETHGKMGLVRRYRVPKQVGWDRKKDRQRPQKPLFFSGGPFSTLKPTPEEEEMAGTRGPSPPVQLTGRRVPSSGSLGYPLSSSPAPHLQIRAQRGRDLGPENGWSEGPRVAKCRGLEWGGKPLEGPLSLRADRTQVRSHPTVNAALS